MGLVSTAAIVLRTHAYGDTSLIVKCLTEDFGVQTLMARGVRARGGKGGAAPEVFSSGTATYYHRTGRDMHTLSTFDPGRVRRGLSSSMVRMSGAAVLAELVLRHVGEEGRTGLHGQLLSALDRLEVSQEAITPAVVLAEGWRLVVSLGYEPVLDRCVECARPLGDEEVGRFDFGLGGVRCSGCRTGAEGPRVGPGARRELTALVRPDREIPESVGEHMKAHLQLLSDFVAYHVSGARLQSFAYLAGFVEGHGG